MILLVTLAMMSFAGKAATPSTIITEDKIKTHLIFKELSGEPLVRVVLKTKLSARKNYFLGFALESVESNKDSCTYFVKNFTFEKEGEINLTMGRDYCSVGEINQHRGDIYWKLPSRIFTKQDTQKINVNHMTVGCLKLDSAKDNLFFLPCPIPPKKI